MSVKTIFGALALAVLTGIGTNLARAAEPGTTNDEALRVKAALEQSLKSDPNNSEMWAHLGFTDHKLGDVDGAQSAFEKASTLNPKNGDALYMLGLIYEKKKMTAEATKTWNNFLAVSQDKWKRDVAEKHIHHLSTNE